MVVAWIPLLLISRHIPVFSWGFHPSAFKGWLWFSISLVIDKNPWTLHFVAKCSHIISAKNWVFLLPFRKIRWHNGYKLPSLGIFITQERFGGKPHHLQGPLLPTCWRTRAWRRSTRGWPRGSRVRWSTPERVWGSSTSSRAWPPVADHGWWLVGYNDMAVCQNLVPL